MSYNGSGTFQINTSGQPVVAGTVISSTAFNALTADLATGLSTAITKDGQTTATARIPFAQGISSTLTTDSSSVSTGSIITAGGAGIAKNLYVGANANVAGTLGVTGVATFSAAPIYSSLTASSAVATDASKGLVSVTNTGTGNNVLATSPTLVTPILGTPQSGTLTNATGLPLSTGVTGVLPEANGGTGTTTGYYGFKNRIINGAMVIDQRNAGASLAVTAGTVQYSVDRFFGISTNAQCTLQQVATSDADFPYALRLARTTSGVGTGIIQGGQIIETNNCQDLAGQTVAFSFFATAGANFSAASSQIVVGLTCGSGTNQGAAAAFLTGTWTSQTTPLATTQAITTTKTKYTYSVSIPSGTNEIGIRWYYTPVGTAGANDWFQITGVQLEKGSTATSFDYRPFGTELALCQRYYQLCRSAFGGGNTTTQILFNIVFRSTMRSTPDLGTQGAISITDGSNDYVQSSGQITNVGSDSNAGIAVLANFTGLTASRVYTMRLANSNAITLSAEL